MEAAKYITTIHRILETREKHAIFDNIIFAFSSLSSDLVIFEKRYMNFNMSFRSVPSNFIECLRLLQLYE